MTVRRAMTFASAKVADVEALIADETLVLEQKYDGTRGMIVCKRDAAGLTIDFLARNGGALKHTAAMQWFDGIRKALSDGFPTHGETVLDGEIMIDSGALILFDLPYLERDGVVIVSPDMTYDQRRARLADVATKFYSPVSVGQMARTPEEKRALFDSVIEANGEGVMAKSLVSQYDEGKRVRHSKKVKFVKTADVVVMEVRRERNDEGREIGSIKFGVYDDEGVLKKLGKCSPIGKPHCEPGDVIEVRYLYRQAGGALVQPTMLTVREDREPESCGYDQFADYSKAIV